MADQNKSFHDYVMTDLLRSVLNLTSRRMFSDYGLYQDDVMFGLIAKSTLYFKSDEQNRAHFIQHDSQPFSYRRKDGSMAALSFWEVPADILEDRITLEEWVEAAIAAARREKAKKEAQKNKPKEGFAAIKEKFHQLSAKEQDKLLLELYRMSIDTKTFLDSRLTGTVDGSTYLKEMQRETIGKVYRKGEPGTPSGKAVNQIINRAKKAGVDLQTMLRLEQLAYRGFVEFLNEYGGGPESFDELGCKHLEAYLTLVKAQIQNEAERERLFEEVRKYLQDKHNMITDYIYDSYEIVVGKPV